MAILSLEHPVEAAEDLDSTASQLSFSPPSPFHRCQLQEESLIRVLGANVHVRVQVQENPTCDVQPANLSGVSDDVGLHSKTYVLSALI